MPDRKISAKTLSVVFFLGLFVSFFAMFSPSLAANRFLSPEQSQNLALSHSSDIKMKNNEIILKQMKYVEAVKGIQAKVKNLKSFRWSPLLSFKFPQSLNLIEEYELNTKPLVLQTEIETLRHEMADLRYAVLRDVNTQYAEVYILQEKIAFTSERLAAAEDELSKNELRLISGKANQADIDKMKSAAEALTTELSEQKRSFEDKKQKLSDLIGLDVTSGYSFLNNLKSLYLPRENLEGIISHTLKNDHSFYVAKATASTALLNLNAYESLMKNQYGSKMDYIQNFINMAKSGMEVDYAAFQLKYKEMLEALDKPWSGKMRILFFTFTMEWFKGEISGTRYIEDEMYAVYTACMEYSAAKKEQDEVEKELRGLVSDSYENLITAYKAYEAARKISDDAEVLLDKVTALNKLGRADYSELKDARDSYEEMQLEVVEALASYNGLLFEFDRLCCGAVTAFMKGEGFDTQAGAGGDSFSILDPISDPYYYIYSSVADMVFSIGVSIPEGFEPEITAFEVWIDGVRIGSKTTIPNEIRHLALDYQDSSEITLRLYNGNKFVTECLIDASVPRDVLPIEPTEADGEEENPTIGSYTVETTPLGEISISKLSIKLDSGQSAKRYSISYGDMGSVYTTEPISIAESLSYLTLLIVSLDEVTLSFYDSGGELLYKAGFDSGSQTIYKITKNQ
ncbi:MAG: TolC family protein [Clostridiales bacterium]|nr:TolC family protein [Clostridiales bacterium]